MAASFISSGYENVAPGPVQGAENKPQELEWDKAARGELQEKSEIETEVPAIEKQEEEQVEEEVAFQRPSMDLFKSIFADSDSEEEDVEEEMQSKGEPEEVAIPATSRQIEETERVIKEEDEMDVDVYGPRLPVDVVKAAPTSFSHNPAASHQEEWVERDKAVKKKKDKKDKKKKSKKKKDKKSKNKRKRRHSDVSSNDTDDSDEIDDAVLLEKIMALKKQHKL